MALNLDKEYTERPEDQTKCVYCGNELGHKYKWAMAVTRSFKVCNDECKAALESYIQKAGFVKGQNYFKEMYIHEIEQKWNVNLSAISNQGKMEKRFDFVIKTDKQIYVIETNFYAGGSKLNETARSYKTLAQEVATIDGVTFIWFTDGCGWNSAKNNLEETFDVLDTVYNIQDLENEILFNL